MSPVWSDVGARARGLGTRLLGRRKIEELAGAKEIAAIAFDLDRAGFPVGRCAEATPESLEEAVRRVVAERMAVLARWCGPARAAALAAFFEEENRRSVRALVRRAIAGLPPAERARGLLPTPDLPARALDELAQAGSAGQVAAILAAWESPYAEAIRPEALRAHPDLFALDAATARVLAQRALAAGKKGGRAVRAFAQETVDLLNARAALAIAAEPAEIDAESCFVPGGARITKATFLGVAAARKPGEGPRALADAFAGTALEAPFRRAASEAIGGSGAHAASEAGAGSGAPAASGEAGAHARLGDFPALERDILAARIAAQVAAARRDPLGAGPVLAYLLRLRAEAHDLRRVIAGVALGAPREVIVKELVGS